MGWEVFRINKKFLRGVQGFFLAWHLFYPILDITEMHTEAYQKYSYHWKQPNGDLIMGWDNKAHWRELKTFPHHKHIEDKILPYHRITLEEALIEIKNRQKDLEENS